LNKIFGIGWAKTGTKTLGECFKILGFNHQSTRLDLVEKLENGELDQIMNIAKSKDTFEDWPWLILYKEFDQTFPESKFILTYRDPENWLKSYLNMLAVEGKANNRINRIRSFLYQLPFPNVSANELVGRYIKHFNDVQEYFINKPDSLLIVDWEKGDGWKEICDFIKMPIPNKPFPHANRGLYKKYSLRYLVKKIRENI